MSKTSDEFLQHNFSNLCRFCLKLLKTKNHFDVLVKDEHCKKIRDTFDCSFSDDDGLPNTVCSQCNKNVKKFIDFRNNCLATYKILQDFLINVRVTVKNEVLDENDLLVPKLEQHFDDVALDSDSVKDEVTSDEAPQIKLAKRQHLKGRKTRLCVICGKLVKRLNQHIKFHTREKMYECFHCQKKFYSRGNFITHVRIHFSIKNYKCDQCPLEFVGTSGLKKHFLKHNETRKYTCQICSESFKQNYSLKTHQRLHTQHRPFPCLEQNCGKKFFTRYELKLHGKRHAARIKCTLCNKSFRTEKYLRNHKRIHSGELPFQCELCSKAFCNGSGLASHMKGHFEQPMTFACDSCDRMFVTKSGLNSHSKTHKKLLENVEHKELQEKG